jgi:cell division initiation protein
MGLGPDDIVSYEFRQQKVRGYDTGEVDRFLDQLADQVERADREIEDLRRRLRDAEARAAAALETESTLKRTLVTAQEAAERALAEAREQADELREQAEQTVDERLAHAREEARTIVEQAQQEARAELATARQQRAALEDRLAALRDLEHRHRTSLERHLRAQLEQLGGFGPGPAAPSRQDAQRPPDQPRPSSEPASSEHPQPSSEPASSEHPQRPAEHPQPASEHPLRVRVRGAGTPGTETNG